MLVTMTTLQLRYGPMNVTVEQTEQGFQRVARYTATLDNGRVRTLTSKSKVYKTFKGAEKEAKKYIAQQKGGVSA